jgi:hypothetical protein
MNIPSSQILDLIYVKSSHSSGATQIYYDSEKYDHMRETATPFRNTDL